MPSPTGAWLGADGGQVLAGTLAGGRWSWTLENLDASGNSLALGSQGLDLPVRAISVDASGHGYAVGDKGLVLERSGNGPRPWRRLDVGYLDNFYSVALSPDSSGGGALIGGENG